MHRAPQSLGITSHYQNELLLQRVPQILMITSHYQNMFMAHRIPCRWVTMLWISIPGAMTPPESSDYITPIWYSSAGLVTLLRVFLESLITSYHQYAFLTHNAPRSIMTPYRYDSLMHQVPLISWCTQLLRLLGVPQNVWHHYTSMIPWCTKFLTVQQLHHVTTVSSWCMKLLRIQ